MAKSRTANRGWRSKMKKHLADNPEVQEQVNARRMERLSAQSDRITEFQDALKLEQDFIQSEMTRLSPSETEEPSEAQH